MNLTVMICRAGALVLILLSQLIGAASATPSSCLGDCDAGGSVTVDELVRGVNIALGLIATDDCPQFDRDGTDTVSVDEIITAVQNALNGCIPIATPTTGSTIAPTSTRTGGAGATATPTTRPTTPPTANFVIRGKVLQAASGGGGISPAADAEIEATIDRDGNGEIGGGESRFVTADAEGNYVLQVAVAGAARVVVGFRSVDSAPLFRTLDATPGGDVIINATLRTAEQLSCETTRCTLQGNRLTIDGLPAGVGGNAQLFNPATQPDAFPGDFSDTDGNLLLSGVFASVELVSEAGQPVKQLATPATLRMQIPRETWPIVTDTTAGNGRIDVPMYAFDEVAGTWVRDGAAVLENDQGELIPESSLASIRGGSFAGNVVARGQVQHFSFWNIDWPIGTHGCVSGTLLDDSGLPARGASVTVRGLTYVGSSTTTTDIDGHFCADVLRSEAPGEDVDQDGVFGETQRVTVRVAYSGHVYNAGELDIPVQSATCNIGCASLGEVRLTSDLELQPAVCTFTVNVRDRSGSPVAGAFVIGIDSTVDPEVDLELCADQPFGFCMSSGTTDENGNASLTTVLLDSLFVIALSMTQEGDSTLQRWGEATRSNGCPADPVFVTLTEGFRQIMLVAQFTPPRTISWTPTTPITAVTVTGGSELKWLVVSPLPGFEPPVTYGTVPAGAIQFIPGAGAPPALASGDFISIALTAPGDDGYPIIGTGFAFVP